MRLPLFRSLILTTALYGTLCSADVQTLSCSNKKGDSLSGTFYSTVGDYTGSLLLYRSGTSPMWYERASLHQGLKGYKVHDDDKPLSSAKLSISAFSGTVDPLGKRRYVHLVAHSDSWNIKEPFPIKVKFRHLTVQNYAGAQLFKDDPLQFEASWGAPIELKLSCKQTEVRNN